MQRISTADRRARLVDRHRLDQSAGTIVQCAGELVGLHSSDPATVYVAAWARVRDVTADDVAGALYDDRSVVRMLGMRRTLFVVPRDLAAVMDAACTKGYAAAERRRLIKMLETQDIATNGDGWVDSVMNDTMAALVELGTATATELRELVPELKKKLVFGEGKKWGGEVGVSTRIMFLLATEGKIVRGRPNGSWISSQYRWAPVTSWLGEPLPCIDKAAAQADLIARWLRAYGPGTATDMKWWTGWSVKDTKAALAAVDAREVELDGGTGYVLPEDSANPEAKPGVALLPALDPTVMGWKERAWYLGDHAHALFDRNGNAGPTVWSDGRIIGGWGQDRTGAVRVELLEDPGRNARKAIHAKADALASWLSPVRISPRFPTPLEKVITRGE